MVGVKHVKAAHATDTVSIVKDGANATTGVAIWDFVDAALAVDGIVDDVFYEGAWDVTTAVSEDAGGSKGAPARHFSAIEVSIWVAGEAVV